MSATTTAAATTSVEILHHAATFLSQVLSQPDLRHHLFSTFLQRLPSTLIKPLNSAFQTIENAISTAAAASSSLRSAEKLLLSNSHNPFASFLLSLVHYLRHREIDASLSLLDVFQADPSLCRLEIAPFLFQELFLIHFASILEWYNEQRSSILYSFSLTSDYNSDDHSIISNTTLLSKMSGDQASALRDLERDYEDLLDENCRIFVEYFKRILRNKDGDQVKVPPPTVVLQIRETADKLVYSDEEKIKNQEFESTNRRYNPMWAGGDRSVEFSSNRAKSLSKFPSFVPERVSPKVITNQRSSEESETSIENDFGAKLHSSANENLSDYSSSDSEAESKGRIKTLALFDSRKITSQKQKQPLSLEESRGSPHLFMEDIDNVLGGGKSTPPKDFVCPITTHVFHDPVTLETGQTYERTAIQEWIDRGNSTCPITRQKLSSTQLPKTNYVLKRLIASWQEQNQGSALSQFKVMQAKVGPEIRSVSPNSVISQATIDGTMSELRLATTDLCTSEVLRDAETAVLTIERFWEEGNMQLEMISMLTKPPVINGFVEILFNSVDKQVLKATILLLTELGSRDVSVIQTLTAVDSDVECIVELFKKGLVEAVVLVHLLRPQATSLVEMDLVDYLLAVLGNKEDDDSKKMCMNPRTASLILLGDIIRSSSEARLAKIVRSMVATNAIEKIVVSLQAEQVEERLAAVTILLRCVLEDGKCRNIIAEKAEFASVLEIFVGANDAERFEIVHLLSELVKLNRRNLNEQILHLLKDEGTFSTMHNLLMYLQNALQDQSPIVAGLLLQLDLLDEPRKMSIYREEAIDALISGLRNSEFPVAQISAAETVLSLQGRFSYSGKSLSRAILLKRAGLDRSYRAFMRKDKRRHNISADDQDTKEDEKAGEEWERRVAFALVSHEFGLLFEGLAEGLKSRYEELQSVCFMAATWLTYMLSILPDTGVRGAARVCFLKHFVSVFKSRKNTEDRALSMLALNTLIRDPEGLQGLGAHMKDILKGLRELKKSSSMAVEMPGVQDIWNHKELSEEDCSMNGEVLTITCFRDKIFSGHSDGTIKVWSSEGSELHLIQEICEHTKAVTSLAVLHSSDKLYSGSLDRTVRVWVVSVEGIYCEQVQEMKDHINNLVVANNIACYIPQGAGVKVYSWNGSSKLLNQQKYAKCLALVQGKVYCGCMDNSIQEIDLATGTLGIIQSGSKKLLGKAYPIYALEIHDGLIYAAGPSFDGANVKIWSTSNYSMVGSLPSTSEIRTMAVSSDLVYLGCKGGTVEVWCRKKHSRVETLQVSSTAKILCMAIDANEDMLIIGTSDGRIQTWGLN
ncbi:putative E3 ubiquitin-protein ligase LIN [Sesamum indicum]|uniref:RING-type E3 ubiquitin transferase n=1 Tax=Sesamum indicum TaxID=4182 RepID=A0A8M8USN4_SESIN|nr:putative E3 ubiquitin-protein ligase LIN [Sesamum indicum]